MAESLDCEIVRILCDTSVTIGAWCGHHRRYGLDVMSVNGRSAKSRITTQFYEDRVAIYETSEVYLRLTV